MRCGSERVVIRDKIGKGIEFNIQLRHCAVHLMEVSELVHYSMGEVDHIMQRMMSCLVRIQYRTGSDHG